VLSDLSFLNLKPTEEKNSHYCLQKSHVSIVICGSDNLHWVGYAFTNSADNEEENESYGSETDEDGDGDEGGDEDEDEDGSVFQCDLFASDDSYRVIDANIPIYDAREYWLCVVHLRIGFVVRKWEYVVLEVEQSVRDHVGC
jgi:hypothetical protein